MVLQKVPTQPKEDKRRHQHKKKLKKKRRKEREKYPGGNMGAPGKTGQLQGGGEGRTYRKRVPCPNQGKKGLGQTRTPTKKYPKRKT